MTLDLLNTQWILSHGPWTISLQFIHVPFCQNPSTGHSLDFSPVLESSWHVIKSLDSESGRGSLEYSVGASLRPTPQMVSSFARSILLCARIHVMVWSVRYDKVVALPPCHPHPHLQHTHPYTHVFRKAGWLAWVHPGFWVRSSVLSATGAAPEGQHREANSINLGFRSCSMQLLAFPRATDPR